MEGNAKRIGKFNIIDIVAVVLIVAVAAFAGWKILGPGQAATERTMVDVTYQVKVEEVPVEAYENCLKHIPSRMMASGSLLSGEIQSVEKLPYRVLGPDGQWVEDPDHVTLIFTATTQVADGDVMMTKVGDQEIRIGKETIIKSEFVEFAGGVIIDVQWDK